VIKATNHNKVPPKSKHVQGVPRAQLLPGDRLRSKADQPQAVQTGGVCRCAHCMCPPTSTFGNPSLMSASRLPRAAHLLLLKSRRSARARAVLLQNMAWAQSARYINRCLVHRAHALNKWLIVLKVCITHHRLLRESRGQYACHVTDPSATGPAFAQPGMLGAGGAGAPLPPGYNAPPTGASAMVAGATGLQQPGQNGMAAGMTGMSGHGLYMQNDACPPLGLRGFRDGSSKKAFDLSTFIRFYAAYLDAQLDVYSNTKYVPVNVPGAEPPKFKCAPLPSRYSLQQSRTLCSAATDRSSQTSCLRLLRHASRGRSVGWFSARPRALSICREMEVEKACELLVQLSRMATHLTACVPMRLAAQSELVQARRRRSVPACLCCAAAPELQMHG
jgi:hypothetical protein